MTNTDILRYRLINQQIAGTEFKEPQEIVTWLGAMQAQEYAMAKWAIGLRLPGLIDADVEKAFNDGDILRTHMLRPTWHFVSPADIRWMLSLTAPRVNAVNAYYYRKFELDNALFKRSNNILAKSLQGGKELTRNNLKAILARAKINADGLRLIYLMMRAELEGIICSGARDGKQFTYALLEEKVPVTKSIDRETALGELTLRYFRSRGPATIQDFAWWSGLTLKEAKQGVSMVKSSFVHEIVDGYDYWFAPGMSKNKKSALPLAKLRGTFLLPDYDEYGISYKNRSALSSGKITNNENQDGSTANNHWIVIDGRIEGNWQCKIKNNTIAVETRFFTPLGKTKQREILRAIKRYTSFADKTLGMRYQKKNNPKLILRNHYTNI
jgi:hypothetical protein